MGRKHCARRWWRRGQYHSSIQVAAESVASAMSVPSFSLFSDSQSLFSRNPSSSYVENTIENIELEGGKGNNINASFALDGFVHDLVFSQLTVVERSMERMGPCKLGVQNELFFICGIVWMGLMGEKHCCRKLVSRIVYPAGIVICRVGICWNFLVSMDLDYKPKVDWDTNCHVIHQLKANLSKRLHFVLGEFALVTGLKCKGDTSIESIAENRLISKYFGTASVTFAQLADCFKKKKWETDDDALKIAVLYFVNNFLLSQLKTKVISRSYIDLVECGDYNNYPWGIDVYKATIDSCSNKFQDKPSFYRLGGFPLALQTWLYECCPSLDGHFADHLGNKLPRILNWVVMGQIPNERVALQMCSLQREQLKNITPTDDEKQLFDVRGLNFEIEVECTDSQPDSFQVFGTQLPKTQSMHESTVGDSQPTNAEVMKELQALKLFVETKFEEVLAAIGWQSMKPEGNSAHKQQDNDPDFREMHNDYDQFESGHVGNDPVVLGDSMPKAPSISGFGGVGQDGGATGVNMKNVTTSDGVVNDDFGLDFNFKLSASAIDQITAITQQATYKQSSHDVKKSGPAIRNPSCRVDGVGQVDVGGSNVNLPSAPCRQRGDLHLDSDFEYTDSQLDLIAAITQGGKRNINQYGNELTTRTVNKSKHDQSVSRSIVQIQTDVETTPAVFALRRRPAAHLNIIFYYLRKKAKYGINMPIKVTTTDTLFNNIIQRVFTEFVKGGKQDHLIDRADDIMEYMKGFRMHCNTLWHQVDHVIFPINLAEIWHWILGCVSFHKRCFYVYDSLRSRKHKKAIQKVAEAYAVLIPLFLISIEFYNQRSDIVVENGLHMGKKLTGPFVIELITNLPTQQNSDCGVYVACFAEYIIEDLPIPVANFDVDGLRARFGILLWHYGRNKQLHGESSESEAPVAPKKTRGKKRKK
ncbi:uncharacterized protein LOC142172649 [Nicotiana tabacum]|uniref:Uncharacterized protein LOC142172649 n=1 Tax=Nicotiana tabacum TaxID=4097 RepID=A0AC58T5C4_TOBAC